MDSFELEESPVRLLIIAPRARSNSLGRVYALWLLGEELGWKVSVLVASGVGIWEPLVGTKFASQCLFMNSGAVPDLLAAEADLILAVKPDPLSVDLGRRLSRDHAKPILLDIDDPDLEAALSWSRPVHRLARGLREREVMANARRMQALIAEWRPPIITSNPTLSAIYGGHVVPHARPIGSARAERPGGVNADKIVAFVGTNRRHKGVHVLRGAVKGLRSQKFRLRVTDEPPRDARPWEEWLGLTDMETGMAVTREADVVAIPSLRSVRSNGQLPAKLIDAMMAGCIVVASDLPAIRWALGGTGILVKAGSKRALAEGLVRATSPESEHLGMLARERAIATFSVAAVSEDFASACKEAVRRSTEQTSGVSLRDN